MLNREHAFGNVFYPKNLEKKKVETNLMRKKLNSKYIS